MVDAHYLHTDIRSMSKHNSSSCHRTTLKSRLFIACCLCSAAILVWTQRYEYEEKRHTRHRFDGYDHSATITSNNNSGGFGSGMANSPTSSTSADANTFSCRIHKMNLTLPRAPDLIIAGAPKSGTTTLAHWLKAHPNVLPTKKWECHFFNTGIHPQEFGPLLNRTTTGNGNSFLVNTSRDDLICQLRKRYLRHWPDLTASVAIPSPHKDSVKDTGGKKFFTFDKTPDYLYPSRVPALIRVLFGSAQLPKVVVLLRNPIDRAYSHYRMTQRFTREEHVPFEEFVSRELRLLRALGLSDFYADFDRNPSTEEVPQQSSSSFATTTTNAAAATDRSYSLEELDELYDQVSDRLKGHNHLSRGLYAMQLERWFRHGFEEELLIMPYTELERDPAGTYSRILDFVGLPDHSLSDDMLQKKFNYNNERTILLRNSTRLSLEKFYQKANLKLAELLQRHDRTCGFQWSDIWER